MLVPIWIACALSLSAYAAAMYGLALRLNRLQRTHRIAAIPTRKELLENQFGARLVDFVLSARHKAIGDPIVSCLVMVARVALPATFALFAIPWLTRLI